MEESNVMARLDHLEDKMCSEFKKAKQERTQLDKRLRKVEKQTARQGGRINGFEDGGRTDNTALGEIKGYTSTILTILLAIGLNLTLTVALLKFVGII